MQQVLEEVFHKALNIINHRGCFSRIQKLALVFLNDYI